MSAVSQMTKKRPLPGTDSMGRDQREILGLVCERLAGTGSGACWPETNQTQEQREVPGPVWIE